MLNVRQVKHKFFLGGLFHKIVTSPFDGDWCHYGLALFEGDKFVSDLLVTDEFVFIMNFGLKVRKDVFQDILECHTSQFCDVIIEATNKILLSNDMEAVEKFAKNNNHKYGHYYDRRLDDNLYFIIDLTVLPYCGFLNEEYFTDPSNPFF